MAQTFDIRPTTGTPTYDTWTLGAGATKAAAVDPLNPIAHDDDTTYIAVATPTTTAQSFLMGLRPEMFTVSLVQGFCRWKSLNNWSASQTLRLFSRIGTTDSGDLILTGAGDVVGNYTDGQAGRDFGTLPRPGGGTWTVSDLLDGTLQIGCSVPSYAGGVVDVRVTSLWIRVTGTLVPSRTTDARLRASAYLRMFRRPQGLLEITTTPDIGCDVELLERMVLTHTMWPTPDGRGAGMAPWQRARLIKLREEILPDLDLVKILLYNPRFFDTYFWDGGHTRKSASSFADGVPRLDRGSTRTFLRSSKAYVEDPGGGTVKEVGDDTEKYDAMGLLIENFSTNYMRRSSFISGTTGLTLINANGGGQGTVAVDTTDLLFDSSVSANSIKIAATSGPQASDLGFSSTTAALAVPANTVGSISIDYKNDTGGTLEVQITRGVDGFYLVGGSTWQVGVYTHTLPSSTTKTRWKTLTAVSFGGSATTVTFQIVQLNGATAASQIDHVYHMQLEPIAWVTSRIPVNTVAVSREMESLKISNNAGARSWPNAHGSAKFKFFSEWDAAVMNASAGLPNYFYVPYDGNNEFKFGYEGAAGSVLHFRIKVGGTTYTASAPYSPTAYPDEGDWIGIRWTSSEGELGLEPYTLSVFVNGVKGTDAISLVGMPAEAASSDLYIGGNDVDWSANGAMRHIWITDAVLTDEEMARNPH